jgi:hypothetical protein
MAEPALQLLETWLAAVNNGELERVTALYGEQATLLPTFSNHSLHTPAGIQDYFQQLGNRKGLAVALHPRTLTIQRIADQKWCLSGIYRWAFEVDQEPLSFEARFSFLVDLDSPSPILHHHSSQIPRML